MQMQRQLTAAAPVMVCHPVRERPMRFLPVAILISLAISLTSVLCRPLLPIDETRYLAVAWEMAERGDFFVSHLNGATYAHKPPLLFWLINLVWQMTGLSDLGGRLVAPACGLLCLPLTHRLSLRLWPDDRTTADRAVLMLSTCLVWMYLSPVTMFDTLLSACALLALLGVSRTTVAGSRFGWLQAGIATGCGILAKGPVILLFVVPVSLLAGWWSRTPGTGRTSVTGSLLLLAVAAVIGLGWAIPSALLGGNEYARELLFGQTAGRMVDSFAHQEPFWWYLPLVPLCLLPWLLLPQLWRGLRKSAADSGTRFVLTWTLGALIPLCLVSGKQLHYLMPLIPGLILLCARATSQTQEPTQCRDLLLLVPATILMASFPLWASLIPPLRPYRIDTLVSAPACLLMMSTSLLVVLAFQKRCLTIGICGIAIATALFQITLLLSLRSTFWEGFDQQPLAQHINTLNTPVAWFGNYHGQLNFVGRTLQIEEVADDKALESWLQDHPTGQLICRLRLTHGSNSPLVPPLIRSDRSGPVAADQQQLLELLRRSDLLPRASSLAEVSFVQWIRTGLHERPLVVVRYAS